MYKCTPASIPVNTSVKLSKNTGCRVSQYKYSHIIGSLMYAMYCTRPDIAFTIGMLSKYTSDPSSKHWSALFTVLRYLKSMMNYGIHYGMYLAVVEGHIDAT